MDPPLTYFTELPARQLAELLAGTGLLDLLSGTGASISMAMLDLDPLRAEVIARLNRAGVAVTAWLVLEEQQGYWLTADNADQAHCRYVLVRDWAAQHELALEAVGLDVEIPLADTLDLLRQGRKALWRLIRGRRSRQELRLAAARYTALLQAITSDGFRSETYQYFFILDDRLARSTLLQRVLGIVDLDADREVLMLYRSAFPGPLGAALVDVFGPEAGGIGVGITGGGVAHLRDFFAARELTLDQLVTELRRARRHCEHVYVFSLEGCVEAGYFAALCAADLSAPPPPRPPLALLAPPARAALRLALRAEGLWDVVAGR